MGAVNDAARHPIFLLFIFLYLFFDLGWGVFKVFSFFATVLERLDFYLFEHVVTVIDHVFAHLSLLQHLVLDVFELEVDDHVYAGTDVLKNNERIKLLDHLPFLPVLAVLKCFDVLRFCDISIFAAPLDLEVQVAYFSTELFDCSLRRLPFICELNTTAIPRLQVLLMNFWRRLIEANWDLVAVLRAAVVVDLELVRIFAKSTG